MVSLLFTNILLFKLLKCEHWLVFILFYFSSTLIKVYKVVTPYLTDQIDGWMMKINISSTLKSSHRLTEKAAETAALFTFGDFSGSEKYKI